MIGFLVWLGALLASLAGSPAPAPVVEPAPAVAPAPAVEPAELPCDPSVPDWPHCDPAEWDGLWLPSDDPEWIEPGTGPDWSSGGYTVCEGSPELCPSHPDYDTGRPAFEQRPPIVEYAPGCDPVGCHGAPTVEPEP